MRRALVLISMFWVALMCTDLILAAGTFAAPSRPVRSEIERSVNFDEIRAQGFGINVSVNNNDGEVTATIVVNRGRRVAYYTVPATITARRVSARFGTLGELAYTYQPIGGGTT